MTVPSRALFAIALLTVSVPVGAQTSSIQSLMEASIEAKKVTHEWPATTADKMSADLGGGASLQLTTKYDRINDYTSVTLDKMKLAADGLTLEAYALYAGQQLPASGVSVGFRFMFSASDWKYLTYHPLILLLDNATRLDFGAIDHDGTVGNGYVLEQMTTTVSPRQLQQLLAATTVEGQLGLTEFRLSRTQLDGLRALTERIGGKGGR